MINSNRTSISLNGSWYIVYDAKESYSAQSVVDQPQKKITNIPSVFNISKEGAGYVGVVWYFREITILPHSGFIEFYFEGWYGKAEFFLVPNDKTGTPGKEFKIGERLYGYTPFSIYIKPPVSNWMQSNTYMLVVKIDNREQEGQTFMTPVFKQWGGIHRNCAMNLLPESFIHAVFATPILKLDTVKQDHIITRGIATIGLRIILLSSHQGISAIDNLKINAKLKSPLGLEIPITQFSKQKTEKMNPENHEYMFFKDSANETLSIHKVGLYEEEIVGEIESEFEIWTPDVPILYDLEVNINKDKFTTHIGIRQTGTNEKGQLLLNGEPILFLGVNRHDDHPEFGTAFIPQLEEHDLSIMKQCGFTGIRPAHYPTTEFFLDMCDQMGILVMEEVPNYIMTPEMMKNDKVLERGQSMFKEMIEAHYNHPSIIIWSMANECKTHLPESKEMLNHLAEIGRKLDPFRLYHFTGYPGLQNIAEITANIAGINVYYGDSSSGRKLGPDTLGSVLDNLREFMIDPDIGMANMPLFITEFGSQAHPGYHDIHPYKAEDGYSMPFTIYTEERQAAVIEAFFDQVMDRPYVSGLLVWLWRDNRYEPEISAGCASAVMKYGILDYSGNPKLAFYTLQKSIAKLKSHRRNQSQSQ